MWFKKKKNNKQWYSISKEIKRTVWLVDAEIPIISYTTTRRDTCVEWEEKNPTQDFHFIERARAWDHEWGPPDSDKYLVFTLQDGTLVSVNRDRISYIFYEVNDAHND